MPARIAVVAAIVLLVQIGRPRVADAWGLGAPVGPTGCEQERAERTYFAGAAVGATRARLAFDGDLHYDFEQSAATLFGGYSTPSGWSLRLAAGAILGGELEGDEMPGTFDMGRGFVASASGSRRWSLGDRRWFVTGSLSASAGTTTTTGVTDERLTAFDLRIGAIAGRTFADIVSPYVLARAFGGPVLWRVAGEDRAGSDTTHVQLGAGLSVVTRAGLSAVIDVSVVGEQSASLGVSWQL